MINELCLTKLDEINVRVPFKILLFHNFASSSLVSSMCIIYDGWRQDALLQRGDLLEVWG